MVVPTAPSKAAAMAFVLSALDSAQAPATPSSRITNDCRQRIPSSSERVFRGKSRPQMESHLQTRRLETSTWDWHDYRWETRWNSLVHTASIENSTNRVRHAP